MFRPAIDEARRKWQDPEAILADIGLKTGMTFIDVGCGGGFFTLPAAVMAGENGKVYGIDANARSVADLEALAARQNLGNISVATGKAEEMVLCRECADIVFFGIALHDFQEPARVLANARKMVQPSGILANLDWDKESVMGPPAHIRFSREKATRLIEAAGFKVESVRDSGRYHYLVIARPD